jgi:hypothetical protein
MPSVDLERASSLCLSPPRGRMAGIFGEGACALALRALARPLLHGEAVVAVDGGNRFDPYEISKAARALGGDGRKALSRIRVSRAFTCHQMEALLAHRLAPALARFDAGLALVIGLPETFTDADVPYMEACRIFRGCLSALHRIASGGRRVVLVGRGERGQDVEIGRAGFFRHLVRIADPLLLFAEGAPVFRASSLAGPPLSAGGC